MEALRELIPIALQFKNKVLFEPGLGCEDEDCTATVNELQMSLLGHIICPVI